MLRSINGIAVIVLGIIATGVGNPVIGENWRNPTTHTSAGSEVVANNTIVESADTFPAGALNQEQETYPVEPSHLAIVVPVLMGAVTDGLSAESPESDTHTTATLVRALQLVEQLNLVSACAPSRPSDVSASGDNQGVCDMAAVEGDGIGS